ncbi:MAG: sodium:solute symporter family protein [Planctomycetota bacterium]
MSDFSVLDIAIVVLYLGASVAIGLWANRFITGLSGYLVAGRSLGTALSIATMTGSELGLITVMYQAQKGFTGGFAALHIGLIAGIVTLFVGLTGFIVVGLRRARVMTIPEYYEVRFDKQTRVTGGIFLALGGILNMGLFLRVGSEFVVGVTGLEAGGATIAVVMTVLLALVLLYTVLGGMVSVVLTDYLQFVVLSIGLVALVVLAIGQLGFDHIAEVVAEKRGAASFDPTAEGSGFGWDYITWMGVLGLVSCAIWPTAVTRALSARDEGVVKRQYTFSSISFMIRFLLPCFLGIAAFVFLTEAGATMLDDGSFILAGEETVHPSLRGMPVFLRETLPIGVLGLLTAAMLAAFMSTHDSYLLCWASVISRDIIAPLKPGKATPQRQLLWTRIGIVVIGLYVLFWGIAYEPGQDVWDYLGITGAIYFTGAIVVLAGGLYWKRASRVGARWALYAGLSAVLGLGPVKGFVAGLGPESFETWLLDRTSPQIGLATLGTAVLAMIVGSLLFPDEKEVA